MSARIIPADGEFNAKLVVVGEAPGADEERIGRPFVGASGEALNDYLTNLNLTETTEGLYGEVTRKRHDCYVTNVIKERPPHNNIAHFITRNTKGVVKMTPEYERYEAELLAELSLTSANVIVVLGNVALWATTRKWGIEKWRGSILEGEGHLKGRKIIPTYHPAFAIREPLAKYVIKLDFARIAKQLAFPEVRRKRRLLHTMPTLQDAIFYIRDCHRVPLVGFDIESKPCGGSKADGPETWEMSCFALAKSDVDAMSIPILGENGLYWTPDEHDQILCALARLLDDPNVKIVGQNLNFDLSFLLHKHSMHCGTLPHDTMIAQRLILSDDKQRKNPILPIGLDFLCSIYTEEPYYKDEGKQWFDTRDWRQFYEYNARDAAVCLEIWPQQQQILLSNGNLKTYERHIRTLPSLLYMQERGVRSDTETLARLKTEVRTELDSKLAALMERVAGTVKMRCSARDPKTGEPVYIGSDGRVVRFNESLPNSPAQCKAYFYGVLRHPAYKKKGGGITVDDEALIRLSRKGVEEASAVLAYRKLAKLSSAYLDAALDGGRFYCQYKPVGPVTGRLSSAKNIFGFGLNLQTLPRKGPFKGVFLPDANYLLVSQDYSQAENRNLAYSGGVTALINAFETGVDAYSVSGSRIAQKLGFSLGYDDVVTAHKRGELAPIAGGKASWRQLGKVCNLALSYNMGVDRFSREHELPLKDAGLLHAAWHQAFPEVRNRYHVMIQDMLNRNRTIINPFGRHRKFLGRHSRTEGRSDIIEPAYAHFCQSTVADAINEYALCYIMEDTTGIFDPLELLLQVHDSIVYQLPLSLGLDTIAATINAVASKMSTPISWNGVSWRLPVATSVSSKSLGDMVELGEGAVTADQLNKVIETQRGAVHE